MCVIHRHRRIKNDQKRSINRFKMSTMVTAYTENAAKVNPFYSDSSQHLFVPLLVDHPLSASTTADDHSLVRCLQEFIFFNYSNSYPTTA